MHLNYEDSAGSQLALLAAVKLLLAPHRGDLDSIKGLRHELDNTRELLASLPGTERKLLSFEVTAESLMAVLAPPSQSQY
ncbi:hypothetical protein [Pseudorhodoferax soli]|uniref:Uncharacterized protein n=1 Tax=Pseudorhodoferax soli TaxID=545864 RepID=A0A368Y2E2_9BURK|nr:hypothetical protein [Pseudorhodoferax soli]RCW72987.1 hypothetical protein DES41_103595 [Pseudorhodoferax soli]